MSTDKEKPLFCKGTIYGDVSPRLFMMAMERFDPLSGPNLMSRLKPNPNGTYSFRRQVTFKKEDGETK